MNKTKNQALKRPLIVSAAAILLAMISLFLPYLTATGSLEEYIDRHPNRTENEALELKAEDFEAPSLLSVSKIVHGIYGEDDAMIVGIVVAVFGGFLALTALFVLLKKPIATMIFDLFTSGAFFLLGTSLADSFISEDKYAWGIGTYTVTIALIAVFVGAVMMLVAKKKAKKERAV